MEQTPDGEKARCQIEGKDYREDKIEVQSVAADSKRAKISIKFGSNFAQKMLIAKSAQSLIFVKGDIDTITQRARAVNKQ